nr:hypothetical protein [Pseudomonadota bacterium]
MFKTKAAVSALIGLTLLGCTREGELMPTGVVTTYTACPPVSIVAPTGDVTLFDPATSRTADAIDVVATMTNVRSSCDESGDYIVTQASFEVQARRRDNRGAREVVLPYFATVVQGGTDVVSKSVGRIGLRFADGDYTATTSGAATSQVLRSAATLPEDIRRRIT